MKSVTILIKPKEPVIESIIKDSFTFSFMCLCIYVSQGSTFWTLFSGTMFLLFLGIKVSNIYQKSATTFETKQEAIEFLSK